MEYLWIWCKVANYSFFCPTENILPKCFRKTFKTWFILHWKFFKKIKVEGNILWFKEESFLRGNYYSRRSLYGKYHYKNTLYLQLYTVGTMGIFLLEEYDVFLTFLLDVTNLFWHDMTCNLYSSFSAYWGFLKLIFSPQSLQSKMYCLCHTGIPQVLHWVVALDMLLCPCVYPSTQSEFLYMWHLLRDPWFVKLSISWETSGYWGFASFPNIIDIFLWIAPPSPNKDQLSICGVIRAFTNFIPKSYELRTLGCIPITR